jgi:hypothetical protein
MSICDSQAVLSPDCEIFDNDLSKPMVEAPALCFPAEDA